MIVIPGKKVYNGMRNTLYAESFWFDCDSFDKIWILYLKLLPQLTISVINGVQVRIAFRNPRIEENCISLYFDDVLSAPLYMTKGGPSVGNGIDKNCLPSFDELSAYLKTHDTIRIAIFNQLNRNIYANNIKFELPNESFEEWCERIFKAKTIPELDLSDPKENKDTCYALKLINRDNSKGIDYHNTEYAYLWGGRKPYIVSTNKNDEYFNVQEYKAKGKLGYMQEQCLKEFLTLYFTPNVHLFSSPRLTTMSEFADFIIFYKNQLIVIESKTDTAFEKYPDKVKKKESAISAAIFNATKQLIFAKQIITNDCASIEYTGLFECCIHAMSIITICIVSNDLLINSSSLKDSLSCYTKSDLPIIMSLSTFIETIIRCHTPERIFSLFSIISKELSESDKLPIFLGLI